MADLSEPRAFKFEPRRMIKTPSQFGKSTSEPKPAAGISDGDPRFRAARLQHLVANAAREGMLEEGYTLKEYVESFPAPGMSYDRLVRIQRGETLMQLADLVNFAALFHQVQDLVRSDGAWV